MTQEQLSVSNIKQKIVCCRFLVEDTIVSDFTGRYPFQHLTNKYTTDSENIMAKNIENLLNGN